MAKQRIIEHTSNNGGFPYFLGMVGSAVYYVQQVSGFWPVMWALVKALIWPAFVVYDLLKFIG